MRKKLSNRKNAVSDTDMMTQLRSGALELATMPGTVSQRSFPPHR
jgi:hypothetical protein